MKLYTPEISWHSCDAIYSIDFDPLGCFYDYKKFVTCGVDHFIRIWVVGLLSSEISVEFVCELNRHQKPVNIVRYSPNGAYLASGDDDGIIFVWQRNSEKKIKPQTVKEILMENWTVLRILRGHVQDICDIAWSPDSKFIFTCAQDKTCLLWDISKTKYLHIFGDHKNFVQGVAWDPSNKYLVSVGRDRMCLIYDLKTKHKKYKIVKSTPNKNEQLSSHLFLDENLKCFFRRPSFTPLGEFLLIPTGCIESKDDCKFVSYIFPRSKINKPAAFIPCKNKNSSVIKCCPLLFKLRDIPDNESHDNESYYNATTLTNLPYRIIFAVVEETSVCLYDTQQLYPIYTIENIHYWWLSDLSWSSDGLMLIVTSTDGYCTIVSFQPGELGEPYHPPLALGPPCNLNSHSTKVDQGTTSFSNSYNRNYGTPSNKPAMSNSTPKPNSQPSTSFAQMEQDECEIIQECPSQSKLLHIDVLPGESLDVESNNLSKDTISSLNIMKSHPKPIPFIIKPSTSPATPQTTSGVKRKIVPITITKF